MLQGFCGDVAGLGMWGCSGDVAGMLWGCGDVAGMLQSVRCFIPSPKVCIVSAAMTYSSSINVLEMWGGVTMVAHSPTFIRCNILLNSVRQHNHFIIQGNYKAKCFDYGLIILRPILPIVSQDAMHTLGSHRVYIHGIQQIKSFVCKGVTCKLCLQQWDT